jgi:4-hydroxythreonine-4-phosphate dehydrogenase
VLYDAGFTFPGHTEFVADLTKTAPAPNPRGPVMMLAGSSLRVSLVSIHLPLRGAIDTLNLEEIIRVGRVTDAALRRDFGISAPRIALAGINPHAGEAGSLGREEIEIINPAAARLREAGVNVTDAQAPDSLFHAEARARYDAVLAMYHDQGLIPLKTLHFWDGVNITLGLPIVRTSPDHGTGFDIAGKNKARADSMIAALAMARDFAARRAASV